MGTIYLIYLGILVAITVGVLYYIYKQHPLYYLTRIYNNLFDSFTIIVFVVIIGSLPFLIPGDGTYIIEDEYELRPLSVNSHVWANASGIQCSYGSITDWQMLDVSKVYIKPTRIYGGDPRIIVISTCNMPRIAGIINEYITKYDDVKLLKGSSFSTEKYTLFLDDDSLLNMW